MNTEIVYCKHGYRGDCPYCGRIIVMRWPLRAALEADHD